MEVGLVGLPASGKTTLFNALTGGHAAGFTDKPHVGMADIPDPRLDVIAQYIPPQKIVHATIKLVDIPGVPPGSDAKKINGFLEHVRQVDAVCHVVRCFDDGTGIDAAGDIDRMDTELILADLVVVESALDKAKRTFSYWLDGVKRYSCSIPGNVRLDNRYLGFSTSWNNRAHFGRLDEAIVYPRVLNEQELRAIYKIGQRNQSLAN